MRPSPRSPIRGWWLRWAAALPRASSRPASTGATDPADTTGTITYNNGVFSVIGSHSYAQPGPYSVSVSVTPLTVSVEQVDSSDPSNLASTIDDSNGGDENGNGLTDAPSAVFVDQYAIGTGSQAGPLYTFSLPTVATTSGNYALTNASYSGSEGGLSLSTNGQYLVLTGYDGTVNLWGPNPSITPVPRSPG